MLSESPYGSLQRGGERRDLPTDGLPAAARPRPRRSPVVSSNPDGQPLAAVVTTYPECGAPAGDSVRPLRRQAGAGLHLSPESDS